MKKIKLAALFVGGMCLLPTPAAHAQNASSQNSAATDKDAQALRDQDIELLRRDIRSKKKQLIAANLPLTDTEATKFWPVYDQYINELVKINNTKYDLIKEFADTYGSVTDEQADSMTKRLLNLDQSVAQLRLKYEPIFRGVLPAKKTATFFQLDRRITMMIDLQLASQIPLVQQ